MAIQTVTTENATSENYVPNHPEYDKMTPFWSQMRDTSANEQAVKAGSTTYLPKTPGQEADDTFGDDKYKAYKSRAVYYEYLKDTQRDSIGLLTSEPTVYTVPDRLEFYLEKASDCGESVHEMERRIYDEQLVVSRGGMLLEPADDMGIETGVKSVMYAAERILNWDDDHVPPRWLVLDESRMVLQDGTLEREVQTEYLLLALDGNGEYYTMRFESWPTGFDMAAPGEPDPDAEDGAYNVPMYPELIGKRMEVIPFTVFNATSITAAVEYPVLLSLSNLALSTYRGEADYRQALFMQGQETLFLKGFSEDERANIKVGAGSWFGSNNPDAEAEFLGVKGEGLSESRESQESLKNECKNLGVELMESGAESGKALNTRLTIRTASLADLAAVSAAAIHQQLTYAAQWYGLSDADIEAIDVSANTDFTVSDATSREMLELWSTVQQGGMTLEDYHAWLAENDFTTMQFDEWMDKVQATGGLALGMGQDFTTDDDDQDGE